MLIDDVSIPNPNNLHNYMLDTCTINKIAINCNDLEPILNNASTK